MTRKTTENTQHLDAGLGQMVGLGSAWLEMVGHLGAEVSEFVADRIKEDVKTQHEIMQCKDLSQVREVQARFLQTAIDQYQVETGRLVSLASKGLGGAKPND